MSSSTEQLYRIYDCHILLYFLVGRLINAIGERSCLELPAGQGREETFGLGLGKEDA